MNSEELNQFFLSFKGALLSYPFGEEAEVYKVGNKMFGLITESDNLIRINLKGDPEDNMTLRNLFNAIIPGYHMNKEHWNTIILDGTLEDDLVKRLISESYEIVFNKLTKKLRESIVNKLS